MQNHKENSISYITFRHITSSSDIEKIEIDDHDVILSIINMMQTFQGYVQFSHREIDREKDIFLNKPPHVEKEDGFIYEAHFAHKNRSVSIRQVNNLWVISLTDISAVNTNDIQSYKSEIKDWDYNIKMAQIWEEQNDPLCEGMKVKKLKKVVFAGFESNEKQKEPKAPTQKKSFYDTLEETQKEKLLRHFLSIFQPEYIDSLLKEEQ